MRRDICVLSAVIVLSIAITSFAQQGPQAAPRPAAQAAPEASPPPLFFRESWKTRPPGTPDGDIPISPYFVANPNLELKLYGHGKEMIMPVQGEAAPPETGPLTYAWSGVVEGNWVLMLKDKNNFVDLTGMAKVRWRTRQRGFHALRPVIRLADGTMLAGDYAEPTSNWWRETEFYFGDVPRWRVLDPELAVESRDSAWRTDVDFSKVDEVGFTDMSRGAGHGTGGSSAVDWLEVYGKSVRRTAGVSSNK